MLTLKDLWLRKSRSNTVIVLALSVLFLSACASNLPDTGPSESPQESETSSAEDLRLNYFSDLDEVEMDYFVSDQAALMYLMSYCQSVSDGNTPPPPDAIDAVVASYCGTDLATAVGVTPAPSAPQNVDVEEFRKISEEKWGFGTPEEDGSVLDPVSAARTICEADTEWGNNPNFTFEGSFQEYAITSFCPEKLP